MGCPDENTLVAFASGSLPMADASLVDEHLDTCPTCFALVAELARTAPEEAEPTRLVLRPPPEPAVARVVALPPPLPPPPASPPPPPPAAAREPAREPTTDKSPKTVVAAIKPPSAEPPPPSQLGRHTLLHRIGADAVGVIYVAHDRELDRRVALKLIGTPKNPSDTSERARIVREARLLEGLRHPNVIEVYDAGEIEEQLYVSMQLVEGESLDRWLLRPRKSWLDRLALFQQAGQGLAAAHAVGIVHRDFRPANVLVDIEGRVRVTDFGFARPTAAPGEDAPTIVRTPAIDPHSLHSIHQPVTHSGVVLGTPAYMAPEMYEGRGDARVDQYAFCIALFEALYRRRPFDANDPLTLRTLVLSGAVSPIPTTTEVPGWMGAIVMRGLSRDPERRFPDMFALLSAIEIGLGRRRKRRIGALAGAAALGCVGLVAGIAAAFGREPCVSSEERLRGIWDPSRRASAAESVHATGLPYADHSWSNVAPELDARALAWAQLHEQVCAEVRERDSAEQPVDPRAACLDRRLVELREVTNLLVKADARAVERSHALVNDWPRIQDCADAVDPGNADDVELHAAIAQAQALVVAGRIDEAAPLVDRMLHRPQRRAVQAEAARLLGELELARGRAAPAFDAFGQAMAAAVAAADARAFASAAIGHGRACLELARFDQGLQSIALGRAAMERLGPQRRLEAELLVVEGALQVGGGRVEPGRVTLQRALEVAEDDMTRASALERLAIAATRASDLAGAEQALQRALVIRETELGAQHPEIARTLHAWSDAVMAFGRESQAFELAARALAIHDHVLDVRDPRLADTLDRFGRAATRVGRREDALVAHLRGLRLREHALGGEDERVIAARVEVGRAQEGLGHHRDALAELRRAVEDGSRALGAEHVAVVAARAELARVHQAEHAWGPALVEIEQVLAIRRKTLGERHALVGVALVRLAEIRRGEGHRDQARTAARQALAILGPTDDPDAHARAQLVLAEVDAREPDEAVVVVEPATQSSG
jgi:serine/threonine protein kinase